MKPRTEKGLGGSTVFFGLLALLLLPNSCLSETISTKYQVEAAFLFNFAKYVDFPVAAFADATSPIAIGVIGSDPFGDILANTIEGKTVNGRPFILKHLTPESDYGGCQIVFIGHSEVPRMGEVLDKIRSLPILTVGEDEAFAHNRGIINFVLKNGNVRLEIDVAAARKAGLAISSRLLAVADSVKGKSN